MVRRSEFFDNFNDSLSLSSKVILVPPYFYGKPYHLWPPLFHLTSSMVMALFKYCGVITLGLLVAPSRPLHA